MVKALSVLVVAGAIAAGSFFTLARAADSGAATTKPAMTCCGDKCQKMANCCTADDKGKVTCSMGGDCCVKDNSKDNKQDDNKDQKKGDEKGMGGMDMGK